MGQTLTGWYIVLAASVSHRTFSGCDCSCSSLGAAEEGVAEEEAKSAEGAAAAEGRSAEGEVVEAVAVEVAAEMSGLEGAG